MGIYLVVDRRITMNRVYVVGASLLSHRVVQPRNMFDTPLAADEHARSLKFYGYQTFVLYQGGKNENKNNAA